MGTWSLKTKETNIFIYESSLKNISLLLWNLLKDSLVHYRKQPLRQCRAYLLHLQQRKQRKANVFDSNKTSVRKGLSKNNKTMKANAHWFFCVIYPSVVGRCNSQSAAGKVAAGLPPCGLCSFSASEDTNTTFCPPCSYLLTLHFHMEFVCPHTVFTSVFLFMLRCR